MALQFLNNLFFFCIFRMSTGNVIFGNRPNVIVSDNIDELRQRQKSAICTQGIVGTKKAKKTIKKKLKRLRKEEESHKPHDRSFGISGISQETYEHGKFKHNLEAELSDIKESSYKDLQLDISGIEHLQKELKYVRKCRYAQRKLTKLNTVLYKESCKEKDKLLNELQKLKDEAKGLCGEENELKGNIIYFQKLASFVFCFCIVGVLNFLVGGLF